MFDSSCALSDASKTQPTHELQKASQPLTLELPVAWHFSECHITWDLAPSESGYHFIDCRLNYKTIWLVDRISTARPQQFVGFSRTFNNEYYISLDIKAGPEQKNHVRTIAVRPGAWINDPSFQESFYQQVEALVKDLPDLMEIIVIAPSCEDRSCALSCTLASTSARHRIESALRMDEAYGMHREPRRSRIYQVVKADGSSRSLLLRFGFEEREDGLENCPCDAWIQEMEEILSDEMGRCVSRYRSAGTSRQSLRRFKLATSLHEKMTDAPDATARRRI
ncbi:hypothetical protein BU16DRAFT_278414 [Lophium mytilinum]|uniref:Uncharacterized protein n=1 Tax=Lophium mytilinum TaxID=390894 RepID=A0A6A6R4G4_9PEZI|nr:hypothetical protein BU16DRAFT_278414 [Lophium mytilinum]